MGAERSPSKSLDAGSDWPPLALGLGSASQAGRPSDLKRVP